MVDLNKLSIRDRVYVIKAIAASTGEVERLGKYDIELTINGVEVDFLAFSRSMVGGVSTDLDERAAKMVRDKLRKLDAIIQDLEAGL